MRSPNDTDRLDPAGKDLINDLLIAAHRPGTGALPTGRADEARALLTRLLIDRQARAAVRQWLRRQCRRLPSRAELDASSAGTLMRRGPSGLADEQVAALLLSPAALHGLAGLIAEAPSDLWLDEMAELGGRLLAHSGDRPSLSVPRPAPERADLAVGIRKSGASRVVRDRIVWELTFRDEPARRLKRRLAEHLYGGDVEFQLRMHRSAAEGRPGMLELALELSPPPRRADLLLRVIFATGEERTFWVEVPPELRADPSAPSRPRTRSAPCEALPAEALRLGEEVWLDETWPPVLRLCRRGGPA